MLYRNYLIKIGVVGSTPQGKPFLGFGSGCCTGTTTTGLEFTLEAELR